MQDYLKLIKARYEVDLDNVRESCKKVKKKDDAGHIKLQEKLVESEKLLQLAVSANNAKLTKDDIAFLAENC